jgi:hypothetical protein
MILQPSRNKIKFNGNIIKTAQFNDLLRLCNSYIVKIITNQINELPINNSLICIQANHNDNIITINDKCIRRYNYYNDYVTINDYNIKIIRNPSSFHQPDDNIRIPLYNFLLRYLQKKNVNTAIFLGGEMYIYGKILSHLINNAFYFTDYKSLLIDSINNSCPYNNNKYKLIDYTKHDLFDIYDKNSDKTFLIANVSKNGLGQNLIEEICKINPKYLITIHCSKKACYNDNLLLLKNKYIYHVGTNINTNYSLIVMCYFMSSF